jgi:hypothetical protein
MMAKGMRANVEKAKVLILEFSESWVYTSYPFFLSLDLYKTLQLTSQKMSFDLCWA